ncbi:MAG: SufD family Fe-S cluster assembly protein [Sphingomonadaceae bacterium]
MSACPTRRDEAWRYSDLDAVASLWPVPPAQVIAVTGEDARHLIVEGGIHDFAITLAPAARMRFDVLNVAPRNGRVAIDVTLGAGADFELNAVQIAGGNSTVEIVTTVRHAAPNATSRQTVRSVLAGAATGSYLGKVAVSRGADGTDSEQAVRAMLLDRTATANAKPELEIYADDVKCAHGCAIGELDQNALFYFAQRGLSPAAARTLLLQAFVAEVFASADPALATAASEALARLDGGAVLHADQSVAR